MSPTQPLKRRWYQYRLRTLLLLVLFLCVWLGFYCDSARQQKASIDEIARFGGCCYYDYELVDGKLDSQAKSRVPQAILTLLGKDFFHSVVEVKFAYDGQSGKHEQEPDEALQHLRAFPHLRVLCLKDGQATDAGMAYVGKQEALEELWIWDEKVTDAGIAELSSLTNLKFFHCDNAHLTDHSLRILKQFPNLEGLSLQGNCFTDEGLACLEEMTQLKELWIDDSLDSLLAGLPHRQQFTDAGVKKLQEALPNCEIHR